MEESSNWVVQNLQSALATWNEKLSEIWLLITQSPEGFKDGTIWNVITNIHGALQAIGYSLLVLFFVVGVMKTCGNFAEMKRPEIALKMFIRFILAKASIDYGLELMMALFNIVQCIVSKIMATSGLSLFEQVMGKDGIDAMQKSIVDRCLKNVYATYIKKGYEGKVPTLVDLCNNLRKQPEPEAADLATAMELFASGSHSTFAHKTNVNIENRLICYDILELGSQLMPIGMLVVLDSILNRITKNRAEGRETYIFIDEIYLLFQHEYSANFLFTLWKRVRKYGAYCTGITQNVDDLLQSHTARTMLSNSEFIIMLNQGSTDRDDLANLLQISETQMPHITNVEVGHGLVMVQKVDLVNLYKDRYGYAIPPAILNEILLSLYSCNKIDFLKNDYIDIKKSAIEECSFLYKATLNRFKSSFSTFAKENDVTVNPKDTVQVFLDFMLKNAVDLNSFFNCLHEDSEINNEQEDDYSKIIIKYLMKIRLENTEIFELLNDIYYGIALSSVMKLDKAEISDLEHNNNITELIVDSNYVFRLLDLQTKYEHQTTIHTHKLAQDAGVEFYILPDTLEQIATTLTRFLDSINPNTISALSPYGDELFSGIHSAYIRNNFSKTELYELITNLQERLECEYSIKSWTKQIADVTESDYEIIESMQKFKPTTDDAGLIHDLKLVKTIDLIRPAYVADMSKAKCWVLTDDNKLMKWSASKYNKKRIPQCLTEAQLSTILWLRSPKEFNGQAFENVVFALLNQSLINKEQYRRISESIEKQKERFSGNPKKLDVMSLLFSTKCLSLNEIDSAADSDEELNRLFDEKMEQSQQYVESVNQVNENYRSENEHIKYMLTKSQNDVEISQRIISEQEKEIITSLQNSIATMELFLSDKQKQLNHLTSKRSREEAKIVTRLNVAILAIGATVIFAILYVNKKYSLMDVHGDLISAIISIICFIFFIVFGTNISDIIKKQKEKLAKTLLKKRMNKGKCENFDDAINHLQQEANALERSLEDVKCNLIEKQNGLKVE